LHRSGERNAPPKAPMYVRRPPINHLSTNGGPIRLPTSRA